jgi:hypothetical protein
VDQPNREEAGRPSHLIGGWREALWECGHSLIGGAALRNLPDIHPIRFD